MMSNLFTEHITAYLYTILHAVGIATHFSSLSPFFPDLGGQSGVMAYQPRRRRDPPVKAVVLGMRLGGLPHGVRCPVLRREAWRADGRSYQEATTARSSTSTFVATRFYCNTSKNGEAATSATPISASDGAELLPGLQVRYRRSMAPPRGWAASIGSHRREGAADRRRRSTPLATSDEFQRQGGALSHHPRSDCPLLPTWWQALLGREGARTLKQLLAPRLGRRRWLHPSPRPAALDLDYSCCLSSPRRRCVSFILPLSICKFFYCEEYDWFAWLK